MLKSIRLTFRSRHGRSTLYSEFIKRTRCAVMPRHHRRSGLHKVNNARRFGTKCKRTSAEREHTCTHANARTYVSWDCRSPCLMTFFKFGVRTSEDYWTICRLLRNNASPVRGVHKRVHAPNSASWEAENRTRCNREPADPNIPQSFGSSD